MDGILCSHGSECQCWDKYRSLVHWTCWRIVRRYGGDYEEAYSEALVLYAKALELYEPAVGKLSNWLAFYVYKGLQEVKRREARRLRIIGRTEHITPAVAAPISSFKQMWADLSTDAQQALVLLYGFDSHSFHNKSLLLLQLRVELRRRLGFTKQQIDNCFKEIQEAVFS